MSSHRQWNRPGRGVLFFPVTPQAADFSKVLDGGGDEKRSDICPSPNQAYGRCSHHLDRQEGISEILVESEEKREKSELSMGMGHTRESSNEINLLHLHVMPIEVQYKCWWNSNLDSGAQIR